ncbi:MAG TPA: asparagine synthase (glutamine-hydrolyzing), partial [Candidatus Obscuribacterales bacterium]
GQGIWLAENGLVGLGHARLAIRDIAHGQQPLSSLGGRLRCVVNGEFYQTERLRRELAENYAFQTRSDSEIALALYATRGLDFVHELHGEFALLLWDQALQRLIAVRDRFGIKPLCYALGPGGLMLASKARALLALGHPAQWNPQALQQSLALQYLLPAQTLFAGIEQLPPGHLLLAENGQVRIEKYWDLDYPLIEAGSPLEFDTARERLATGLRAAVRERLAAEVPVCSHLSGGIDSSTVMAVIAEESPQLTHAFTVAFPEQADYDESGLARASAHRSGAQLHLLELRTADLIAHLPETVRLGEGLSINGHTVAKFLLNQEIRAAGFRVALTGEGADELLLGYAHFRQDLGLAANNPLVSGLHTACGPVEGLEPIAAALGFVPAWLQAKAAQGRRLASLLQPALPIAAAAEALLAAVDLGQLQGRHRVHQSAWLWNRLALANYILPTVGDGAEMAHGIEGRLPFLDHRLFEALRNLPPEAHFRGGLEKSLLREAFADQLIPELRSRPKHPFLAPPLTQFAPWREFLAASFLDLPPLPLIDRPALLKLLQNLPDLPPEQHRLWDPVLNTLLSATWLQAGCKLGWSGGVA